MIVDHLIVFPTEAAAKSKIPSYWVSKSTGGRGEWQGDVCIPGVEVYVIDSAGNRVPVLGWAINIALPALDTALRDLPNAACWRITDRDQAAIGGRKFVLYWSRPAEDLAAFRIEPVFAGDQVPERMRTAPAPTTTVRTRGDWSKTVLVDGAQR